MAEKYYWGVDLGGTKIECVVLDRGNDAVVLRERLPTDRHKGYRHIVGQIARLVELCADTIEESPAVLGIGTPGASLYTSLPASRKAPVP